MFAFFKGELETTNCSKLSFTAKIIAKYSLKRFLSVCGEKMSNIARNRGHFAPVINCQRNLIFKMADRSQGKRVSYDILNNLTTVDLLYEEKSKKKTSSKNILGVYQAERLITSKQDGDVSKTVLY